MIDESPALPHPGVRFPPPFLFAAGLLLGWWLSHRKPIRLLPDHWLRVSEILALAVGAAGLVLIFWGIATFHAHRTAVFPNQPAARIVRSGPYRFTRNPMYTGMTGLYFALTLLLNDAWPLLFLPVVLLLLVRLVITREERYLSMAFPSEYAEYRRQVRRWL
jgi:protein-S-isoprenylcysteine O-methyltransferase Ste14